MYIQDTLSPNNTKQTEVTQRRRAWSPIIAVAAFALTACGGSEQTQATQVAAPVAKVSVINMKPAQIESIRSFNGRAHAFAEAEIRPQVTGIIEKRLFTEGQEIKQGQALYQIEASEYRAAVASAAADLAGAEANTDAARETVKRYQRLIDINAVSRQVYDQAVAALKRAEADIGIRKAALSSAHINLARTKVTAPIDGQIGRSNVTVGALVTSNQTTPLANVFQLDPIYLDLTTAASDILQWKQDTASGAIQVSESGAVPVTIRFENGSTYPHQGALEFSEVSVDEAAGTVVIRANVPNPDGLLLPGMFVKAEFSAGTYDNAFLVPQRAVQRKPTGDGYVYVVGDDGTAQERILNIDGSKGGDWIVLGGLAENDKVIVSGLQGVRAGAQVSVTNTDNDIAQTPTGVEPHTDR